MQYEMKAIPILLVRLLFVHKLVENGVWPMVTLQAIQ